jgi:hypothetical protein
MIDADFCVFITGAIRASVVKMANNITAKINGSCRTLKSDIINSFMSKMTKLLSAQTDGLCNEKHHCWLRNALVTCNEAGNDTQVARHRRHLLTADESSEDETFLVEFAIVGELKDRSASYVTANDQSELYINLEEIFDDMEMKITNGLFNWPVVDSIAEATVIHSDLVEFEASACSSGQLTKEDERALACCKF